MSLKTRLAPTPSGFLHIGNVYSFVLTWLYVKQRGGSIYLRIDDIDKERVRTEYIDNIFKTLEWLDISWDSGPSDATDFLNNHSQEKRMDLYHEALTELEKDRCLFSCSCSRSQIKGMNYNGKCRSNIGVQKGENIRINTDDGNIRFSDLLIESQEIELNSQMKDFVVWRKNGRAAYQLASVIDDIHYDINCVVRGTGLLYSTTAQLYLAQKLNNESFTNATFIHHPLLKKNNEKISKSQSHPSVFEEFKGPKDVFQYIGQQLGLQGDQCSSIDSLKEHFDFEEYTENIHH